MIHAAASNSSSKDVDGVISLVFAFDQPMRDRTAGSVAELVELAELAELRLPYVVSGLFLSTIVPQGGC